MLPICYSLLIGQLLTFHQKDIRSASIFYQNNYQFSKKTCLREVITMSCCLMHNFSVNKKEASKTINWSKEGSFSPQRIIL